MGAPRLSQRDYDDDVTAVGGGCGDDVDHDRARDDDGSPATAPPRTATPPVTPLERYANELTAIGEEVTGGLGSEFCEQISAFYFDCNFHTEDGLLYEVSVQIHEDGSLTYTVAPAMGGM